jgi:hypothetical protein
VPNESVGEDRRAGWGPRGYSQGPESLLFEFVSGGGYRCLLDLGGASPELSALSIETIFIGESVTSTLSGKSKTTDGNGVPSWANRNIKTKVIVNFELVLDEDGEKTHCRTLVSAAWFRISSGPSAFVDVTFPSAAISTSTLAAPSSLLPRARLGYAGVTTCLTQTPTESWPSANHGTKQINRKT